MISSMKKSHILASLFLLALAVRFLYFDLSYFFWDESVYLLNGKAYAGEAVGYEELHFRPPLVPVLLSVMWRLFPAHAYEAAASVGLIVLNSLVVFPLFYMGNMLNRETGLISAIIFALLPASILNSRLIMTDHLSMVFILGFFTMLYYGAVRDNDRLLYAAFLSLFLATVTKFTGIIALVFAFPILWHLFENKKEVLLRSSIFFAVPFLLYLLYNKILFGSYIQPLITAWQMVAVPQPFDTILIPWLINDSLGIIIAGLSLGGLFLLYRRGRDLGRDALIWGFVTSLAYFLYIITTGVSKPPGIEWEMERFLLVWLPFAVVTASSALQALYDRFRGRGPVILLLILLLSLMPLWPVYERTYTPAIQHENGLRHVTKDMGLSIKEDSTVQSIGCMGNCPPIAYYSGKNTTTFFEAEALKESGEEYIVTFTHMSSYGTEIRKFCRDDWCSYLYKG